MHLKLLLGLVFFLGLINTDDQESIWTKQAKISEVIAFEKKINPNAKFLNQDESLSKDYYPLADKYQVANPIIVQRESREYLPLYAEYFYTSGDSILRLISYDWEKDRYGNYFDKQKMWEEESKKFDTYNEEYKKLKNLLILNVLGSPATTDTKAREESYGTGKYYTRNTVWETDDMHANLNLIFASTTYRIRLTIYWKK